MAEDSQSNLLEPWAGLGPRLFLSTEREARGEQKLGYVQHDFQKFGIGKTSGGIND